MTDHRAKAVECAELAEQGADRVKVETRQFYAQLGILHILIAMVPESAAQPPMSDEELDRVIAAVRRNMP